MSTPFLEKPLTEQHEQVPPTTVTRVRAPDGTLLNDVRRETRSGPAKPRVTTQGVMEKTTCECGAVVTKKNLASHRRTNIHTKLILEKNGAPIPPHLEQKSKRGRKPKGYVSESDSEDEEMELELERKKLEAEYPANLDGIRNLLLDFRDELLDALDQLLPEETELDPID